MQIYNFIFNSYTKLSIILEINITKRKTGYNIRYMQFCRRRNTKLHIATSLCGVWHRVVMCLFLILILKTFVNATLSASTTEYFQAQFSWNYRSFVTTFSPLRSCLTSPWCRLVVTIFVSVVANWSWLPVFAICPNIRWLGSIISILAIPYRVPFKFLHKGHFTEHTSWVFNKEYHIRIYF